MARVRMIFSKRGRVCFVPHVEMPALFFRALRRAGARIEMTEGMSPHPRISLGPALPVGVPALGEPLEVWIGNWEEQFGGSVNSFLPRGVTVLRYGVVDGRQRLSEECTAALYRIIFREGQAFEIIRKMISGGWVPVGHTLDISASGNWIDVAVSSPGQTGGGTIVKSLVKEGVVGSWSELLVTRLAVGRWSGKSVSPLPCGGGGRG
ncbi:MAG: TIGR03936 family radical SAM-associated protein [Synergistota bacterium]|nr:TIGR03936 family radical SAM-associated protein [Synergistota bacterium]